MDVKLDNLIDKIKKDGIDEAQKESQAIIDKANQKAQAIIQEAKDKSNKLIEDAKSDIQKLQSNAEKSIQQSARDLVLSLREQLTALFNRLLKKEISKDLSPDFLKVLIVKMVETWGQEKKQALEVVVSQEDKKKLEDLINKEIKDEAKDGIEIKASKTIEKGFHIGIKGQDVYYDFTDEGILEALKEFLSPSIAQILDTDNG